MQPPSLSAEDLLVITEVMRLRSYDRVGQLLGWGTDIVRMRFARLIGMMPAAQATAMRRAADALG